ncbi:MAG: glycosyltransferase, partial [Desulfobacula sp.]|nr:glycosyltransferase [Desulfobacula sp.]
MKVSVIITTYNRVDALKRVLDGLLSQTRLAEQIIVADDGSDNHTKTMLQPYLDKSRINILHVWQKDLGFRAARIRNMAIAKSNGDYLILLDG